MKGFREGSPGLDCYWPHVVSKWLSEKNKTVPPPPPELQSCPPEWLWTMHGLISVLSTPGPSYPKWLQMNETNAQSWETRPHTHPLAGKTWRRMPWGGARGGRIRATSAFAIHLPPPRAASVARLLSPVSSPGPSGRSSPALSLGLPTLPAEGGGSRAGSARGRSPLPQPPPDRSR